MNALDNFRLTSLRKSCAVDAPSSQTMQPREQNAVLIPTLLVARHCATQWNRERRIQGSIDIELSPDGICQATQNLTTLLDLGIQRVVCSTAKRALQTAEIYAEALSVSLQTSPCFVELDHGEWEGQLIDDLLSGPDPTFRDWMSNPEAVAIPGCKEAVAAAQQRILRGMREIASSNEGETVLVISHKHVLAVLRCQLESLPLSCFRESIDESTLPRRIESDTLLRIRSGTV